MGVKNVQYEVEPVIKVSTVEMFNKYFHALPEISKLTFNPHNKVSVSFFAKDIKPAWEDEENANGGKISFLLNKPELAHAVWTNLILNAIGGPLDHLLMKLADGEQLTEKSKFAVNGLFVSPKNQGYMFEIWTREVMRLNKDEETKLKAMLSADIDTEVPFTSFNYQAHKSKRKNK